MSSDGKIYLSREEQIFLMEWLEIDNPEEALDKFVIMMRDEKADPSKAEDYIKKLVKKMKA